MRQPHARPMNVARRWALLDRILYAVITLGVVAATCLLLAFGGNR